MGNILLELIVDKEYIKIGLFKVKFLYKNDNFF